MTNESGNGGISILFGRGDGSFRVETESMEGSEPQSVDVEDFNEDGHQDLVLVLASPTTRVSLVSVLLGTGDGDFQEPILLEAGQGSTAVIVGELDEDSHPDLAVANMGSHDVSVFLNVFCDNDDDGHEDIACGGLDCNDTNAAVNPGAIEGLGARNCRDGRDNDCDGSIDDDPECVLGGGFGCSVSIGASSTMNGAEIGVIGLMFLLICLAPRVLSRSRGKEQEF